MVTHPTHIAQDRCHRCGGLMVREEIREVNQVGLRCVMCGEHIDPLILEHRRKMRTPEGARQLLAKGEKAGMNYGLLTLTQAIDDQCEIDERDEHGIEFFKP